MGSQCVNILKKTCAYCCFSQIIAFLQVRDIALKSYGKVRTIQDGNSRFMKDRNDIRLEFRDVESDAEVSTSGSWHGITVQYSRLHLPAEYEFKWDGHSHYIAYHDLILLDGEMEILGEKPISGTDLRDQMTYVPIGHTIEGWARPADRLNSFTVVYFDPTVMEEEVQKELADTPDRPRIYFKDDELGSTMRKLSRLMANPEQPASRLYAETVGLAAALEITRIDQKSAVLTAASGQLSSRQSKLVLEYIEDHMARDIGLDELANAAGLTRFHFSRAFKATFGEPPYKYLNQRRIQRAKELLTKTALPIADVAALSGFTNASQFGRAFREIEATTPLAFRRQNS